MSISCIPTVFIAILVGNLMIEANSLVEPTQTLIRRIQNVNLKSTSSQSDRETRRINLFRQFWYKPRVSPLYLLDGTVCRFVNFQPVCTTLSTTGVMRGSAASGGSSGGSGGGRGSSGSSSGSGGSSGGGGGSSSGGGSGGNRGSGGGSSSGGGGGSSGGGGGSGSSGGGGGSGGGSQRPSSSGVMAGGSSVQFANSQAFRPAALMDDDPQDLNVDASSNLTDSSMVVRDQQLPSGTSVVARPVNYIVSRRRPINLLPFRRPSRPIQVV